MESALANRKPFRNWNNIIHDTGKEREDWFKFKQTRLEVWVASHLEKDDEASAEKAYINRNFTHEPSFTGISRVVYLMDSIEGAVEWYSTALNMHPTTETDGEAVFEMENQVLILQEREDGNVYMTSSVLVYWNTDDVQIVCRKIEREFGVDYMQKSTSNDGVNIAIIKDSWGNAIGLISNT